MTSLMRPATPRDREFKAKLEALQAEQRALDRKVKAQRERFMNITVEFFALKKQWREETGDTPMITIDWS
jgi:hypothetical protein